MQSVRWVRMCSLPLAWLCLGAPTARAQLTIEAKDTTGALRPSFAIGEIAWAAVTNVGSMPICYLAMSPGTTELFRGEAVELEQQVNGNWRAYTAVKGFIDHPSFTYRMLAGRDTTDRSWRSSPGTFRFKVTYYPASAGGGCAQTASGNPSVRFSRTFTVGQAGAPAPAPAPAPALWAGTENSLRLLKIARLDPDRPVGTGAKFWLRVQYMRANNRPARVTAYIDGFAQSDCTQDLGTNSTFESTQPVLSEASGTLEMNVTWQGSNVRAIGVGANLFVDDRRVATIGDPSKQCYAIAGVGQ